jgi:hypothetical protein
MANICSHTQIYIIIVDVNADESPQRSPVLQPVDAPYASLLGLLCATLFIGCELGVLLAVDLPALGQAARTLALNLRGGRPPPRPPPLGGRRRWLKRRLIFN